MQVYKEDLASFKQKAKEGMTDAAAIAMDNNDKKIKRLEEQVLKLKKENKGLKSG